MDIKLEVKNYLIATIEVEGNPISFPTEEAFDMLIASHNKLVGIVLELQKQLERKSMERTSHIIH